MPDDRFAFVSALGPEFRTELEDMLFFNARQDRVHDSIVATIEAHGVPRVIEEAGRLAVQLDGGRTESQTIFALTRDIPPQLAGAAVFGRLNAETWMLLHIAVTEEFSTTGARSCDLLAMRLMARVRAAAAQVKGVRRVRVLYGEGASADWPVERH